MVIFSPTWPVAAGLDSASLVPSRRCFIGENFIDPAEQMWALKIPIMGTSLVAQWLKLRAPNTGSPGSIPGQETRSHMHAATKSLHATAKEPTCRN